MQVDTSYGAFNVQNAVRFEFAEVLYTSGKVIVLCRNLTNAYSLTGQVQAVRVPQYSALTINPGASPVAGAWNGAVGGIAALDVDGTMTVNGTVSADGLGFRGGPRNTNSLLSNS